MRHDIQAVRKTPVELHLHGVVVVTCVRPVVAQILAPAELLEEGLALVGGERAESVHVGLVGIVVSARAREDVRALGAHVGHLERGLRIELALNAEVPRIHGGEADGVADDERRHAVGQLVVAVRALRLRRQDAGRVKRRGALVQREYGVEIIGGLQGLNPEHGQVLRDVMSKDRTEHAQVVAAPVAAADHGLRVQLIGDAQTRRKVVQGRLHIQIAAHAIHARHQHLARLEAYKTSARISVDHLRTVDFPPQSVVHGQPGRHLPGILAEEKPPVLGFARVERIGNVAFEARDVADQERSQTGAAAARPLRARRVEVELARAVPVARHAQVEGAADIGSELERVVAADLGPVVDELILILVLNERAVAAVDTQGVTELEQAAAVTVDEKCGQAGVEILVDVHARNACLLRWRGADAVGLAKHLVAEPTEAEVREKRGAQVVVEAPGHGVIAGFGRAGIGAGGARGVQARPAGHEAERSRSHHAEILKRIAAEQVQFVGGEVIHAHVEGVVIEAHAARRREIRLVQHRVDVGQGNQLEQILRLRG